VASAGSAVKLVIIGFGGFRSDLAACLDALPDPVHPIVYGYTEKPRRHTFVPGPPPQRHNSRILRPVALAPVGSKRAWYLRRLSRALDEDLPDVVYVMAEPWHVVVLQVLFWARRHPDVAVIVHAFDRNFSRAPTLDRQVRTLAMRGTLPRIDAYIGNSAAAIAEARRAGLRPEIPSAVATLPIDPRTFRPAASDAERRSARDRLALPSSGVGVGFIGRLSDEKGPLRFLDALDVLGDTVDWAVIAGSGPLERDVTTRMRGTGRFLLGHLESPTLVGDFYRSIDVLVVPSWEIGRYEEQSSRVLSEGMLSSNIVVATDAGSNPEMVGSAGIVVAQDVLALADGIMRGIAAAADGDLGRQARARAVELFSSEAFARTLVDISIRAREARVAT
jgi:glycosyltransferase involved in cell wall biosynthesis